MNLVSAFALSVRNNGFKPALFWGESEFTYERLFQQSRWLGRLLQHRLKIQPGDRVGIWLKNCPEFVPALFGILNAGAVAVPINNFLKPPEVSHILADANINVLITESALGEAWPQLSATNPQLRLFQIEELNHAESLASDDFVPAERTEADLAIIIYTSGTTGRPKGAMLSHGNLLHNVESCRQVLEAVSFDRFVLLLPMFHSFMLCVCILLPLIVGGSIVLIKSVHPPKNILDEIARRNATILPAIPQLFRALAHAQIPAQTPLRLCISGAAPLPREILREFSQKFPIPLLEGYGLSEASPVVTMNPIHGPRKEGSIGKPIPDVAVSVQNDRGDQLPAGEVGEICVRGGNVMQGYWDRPAETAQALRSGWLLTGDIGYRDSDGYYFITDRKKDMLLVNGINVYPREIEEVIYQFPGVKEAAVIGIPDPRRGEQPLAFAVANDGVALDEKSLLHFVREKLADYKVPRRVVFLPGLPRNATGKILKTALREMPISPPAGASS
jgi:long-chain acyl-CoA synthetase